jgi:hypothetical protein
VEADRWVPFPRAGTAPTQAVWVIADPDNFDDRSGVLFRLDPATGGVSGIVDTGRSALYEIDVDDASALWLAGFHGVSRLTPDGRRTTVGVLTTTGRTPALGRWPSVAVSPVAAWGVGHAVSKRDGTVVATRRLQRVDLRTGRPVGRPLALATVPKTFDQNVIRIRGGSAWITGPRLGELTRVYLPPR